MSIKSRAVIDMGTNTFHLLIGKAYPNKIEVEFNEKVAVGLGKGGINDRRITPEAMERALKAIRFFKEKTQEFNIPDEDVLITGTSAVRNAKNNWELITKIQVETGWKVRVLDGDTEAAYIYRGVLKAIDLPMQKVLVMDIGGGSVEFIIGEGEKIVWKQSFEIGGQRLVELFHKSDPIQSTEIEALQFYLEEKLSPLAHAIFQHNPQVFIGSSGSFDTLAEMNMEYHQQHMHLEDITSYRLSMVDYERISSDLIHATRAERMSMPGMIPLRVDMIVVAMVLLNYILALMNPNEIVVSTYALKEGLMYLDE
ncbi:MAG: exopolyphosphatase [Cytophagaceae bacterium]